MSHFGVAVEYGLHIITQLALNAEDIKPSARILAEFQGVPAAHLAKIMTRLQKADLVIAHEGKGGGYHLARPPAEITFLDVVDAITGPKKLFTCREVRLRCILYGGKPPEPPPATICGIHAVMRDAEKTMRDRLAETTIAHITAQLAVKFSSDKKAAIQQWFADHA